MGEAHPARFFQEGVKLTVLMVVGSMQIVLEDFPPEKKSIFLLLI